MLSDLHPFEEYLILVKASTVAGWGPPTSLRHWTLSAREYQYDRKQLKTIESNRKQWGRIENN
jgi:hypothetical protein